MIPILKQLEDLLEQNSPDRLYRADDSVSPPRVRRLGYSWSHTHRLALPLGGCHKMEIAHKSRIVTLKPLRGDATFMPKGVWNSVDWYSPVEVATFIFGWEETYINHVNCPGDGQVNNYLERILLPPLDREGRYLMEQLLLTGTEGLDGMKAVLLVRLIVLSMIRQGGFLSSGQGKADHTFRNICSWLEENWASGPSRDETAALFKITPNYLSSLLKEKSGSGYSSYLNSLRMQQACRLLKEKSNLTVSEIAYMTGYSDPAYFNRVFRRLKKQTPLDYRLCH